MSRKIQIVYNEFPPIAKHLARAFEARGYEVNIFYGTQYVHWFYRYVIRVISRWARAFRLIPKGRELWPTHPLNFCNYIDQQFQRRIEKFQPNYLLVIHGLPFSHHYIEQLSIPKLGWWVEPNNDVLELKKNAKPFDIYSTFSLTSMHALAKNKISTEYISHAVCPKEFYPLEIAKDIDLVFVGNWSEWRDDVLSKVLQITPNVVIYGPQWLKKSRLQKNVLHRIYGGEMIVGESLNYLFNRAKVVLNASRIYGSEGLNMRFFEVLATQSLLLTDTVLEISEHFVDGQDLLIYSDLKDLTQLLDGALRDESLRLTIAQQGYQTVLKNHTYDHLAARFEAQFHRLT